MPVEAIHELYPSRWSSLFQACPSSKRVQITTQLRHFVQQLQVNGHARWRLRHQFEKNNKTATEHVSF